MSPGAALCVTSTCLLQPHIPLRCTSCALELTTSARLQSFLAPGIHFAAVPGDASGPGVFGSIPLDFDQPENGFAESSIGVRYASASMSSGVTVRPLQTTIDKAWLLLRHRPEGTPNTHMTLGVQTAPQVTAERLLESTAGVQELWAAANTSCFFEYQSGAKDSYFSVLVESMQVCDALHLVTCSQNASEYI